MYIYPNDPTKTQALQDAFFQTARKVQGKVELLDAHGVVEETFYDSDYVQSIEIERGVQTQENFIGCAISKKYTIKLIDTNAVLYTQGGTRLFDQKRLRPYIGITHEGEIVYVPFPAGMVYESNYDAASKVYTLTCYDDIQKLNNLLLRDIGHAGEEATLREYLTYILDAAGITLCDKPFFNESLELRINAFDEAPAEEETQSSALFVNFSGDEYLREALCKICEAALCNAIINREGELELVSVAGTLDTTNATTFDGDTYYTLSINDTFGPINTVVLSREGEDNVYYPDESQRDEVYIGDITVNQHIALYGLWELKIIDNPILDRGFALSDERSTHAQAIFNQIKGMQYYAYTLDFRGNPFIDEGDRIILKDLSGNTVETTYFADTLTFNGGLEANSEGLIISQTQTEYDKAVSVREELRIAQLKVDKNEGQISSLVQQISSIQDDYASKSDVSSSITQTSEQISATIQKLGGSNLVKNSAFYNGFTNWTLSEDTLVNGPIFDSIADYNTLSQSRLILKNGTLSQPLKTQLDSNYTLSFQMMNRQSLENKTTYVRICHDDSNYETVQAASLPYTQRTTISYTFRASSNETTLVFYTDNGNDDFEISDIRVVLGESAQQWSQHSSEFYGKGILIDNTGMNIKSVAGEEVTLSMDNDSLTIKEGDNVATEVSNEQIQSPKGVFSELSLGGNKVVFVPVSDYEFFISKGV